MLMVFCASKAFAVVEATGSFDAANKLYEEGKYVEAAADYGKLIQSGQVSSALFFNLGNAEFKSGHIGEAIVAYRRAKQLDPRDPDIRANLQFARNQIQGPTVAPGRWQRWLGNLSLNEWTVLVAVTFWICLFSLAAMQLRPALKSSLRNFALVSGIATLVLGVCLGAVWLGHASPTAIVTAHEAVIRSGPLEEAKPVFTAHDGAELAVLDTKDEWFEVGVGTRTGWLKQGQAVEFPVRSAN